jgi:hypothetical protein
VQGYWLKAIGHARGPLAEDWIESRAELLRRTGFPRRPRIVPGDRLVLYASGWRRIFGIAEVVSDADCDASRSARWPWSVGVELLVVVPVLSNAPPVESIGVAPRSMSQQSHIRLEPRHLALAVEALASVGAE